MVTGTVENVTQTEAQEGLALMDLHLQDREAELRGHRKDSRAHQPSQLPAVHPLGPKAWQTQQPHTDLRESCLPSVCPMVNEILLLLN